MINKYSSGGGQNTTSPINKKGKIIKIISIIILLILIIISISFALGNIDINLLGRRNIKISKCELDINFKESEELMLVSKYPISKEEALKYKAKEITIANNSTCDTAYYKVTIKDLVNSSINKDKINYQVVDKSTNTETIDKNPDNFNISDSLTKGNTKSYTIRLWIDESATNTDLFINGDTTKPIEYKYALNIESSDEKLKGAGMTATEFAQATVGTNGLEQITHTIDNTLQVDERFATEYRYRGGNSVVKNYVTFNNETWRIIGIIPTEDTSGNVENRFKIIRDESIGNYVWDDDTAITYKYEENNDSLKLLENNDVDSSIKYDNSYKIVKTAGPAVYVDCSNCGNNWARPSALNTYLNNIYYNSLDVIAKNMIGTTKYYLGGTGYTKKADTMWQYERKNDANRSGYYYGTNPVMQNDANKKIALMYASDYGYGALDQCYDEYWGSDNAAYEECMKNNDWLYLNRGQWTISQGTEEYFGVGVGADGFVHIGTSGDGVGEHFLVVNSNAIRPTLIISSNVKISGGEGTSQKPYTLSVK